MPVRTRSKPAILGVAYRTNRRVSIRYPSSVATACGADTDGVRFREVRVHDVSQGGIGLVLDKPLTVGDELYIQVTNNLLGFSYDLDAEVKHITPFAEGLWIVGFAFPRELTLAELAGLL
jgi:hypothetical protein